MDKTLPDKWVRKAIYDAINDIVVDGITIPCFDSRVTNDNLQHFVLLTTQTNSVDKANKCEDFWNSSILIDVVTSYFGGGNVGNRLLADNIMDAVRNATKNLTLDASSGLIVQKQKQDFPNDITTITGTENVFRKIMRIEFTFN